jgi:hypothetical protein
VKTAAEIDNAPQSEPEAFWGRSPAAKWRLYVEPAALQNANLSGMTEVLISFSYKAFIPPLQTVQSDEQVAYA